MNAFGYSDMDKYKLPDLDFSTPMDPLWKARLTKDKEKAEEADKLWQIQLDKEKLKAEQLCDEVADSYMVGFYV